MCCKDMAGKMQLEQIHGVVMCRVSAADKKKQEPPCCSAVFAAEGIQRFLVQISVLGGLKFFRHLRQLV